MPPSNHTAPKLCRGIRGATTVDRNDAEAILEATREMLYIMIRANEIAPEDVASATFSTTVDLNATFPALAARQLGWYDVALFCCHEMDVPGALSLCVRVLVHWNTTKPSSEIVHVYLREAKNLRPDHNALPPIPIEEIEAAVKNVDMEALKRKTPNLPTKPPQS